MVQHLIKVAFSPGSPLAKDVGLLFIRVGIGLIFMRHGFPKIMAGKEEWLWLGNQMAHLGISFAPIFWGLMASCTEAFGGLMLVIGLKVRITTLFMAFVMFVATVMHIKKGDSWGYISHPLSLMVLFLGFAIAGAGLYSFDHRLTKGLF